MANQTVSVNRNFDDSALSSLANNETITVNSGAIFTMNSDNRWSQNAAVIGNSSIDSTTGGQIIIDGTTVWQVPFSASTGNVPTLGTVNTYDMTGVTSGCQGEFLGVWATDEMIPRTAGGAMPTTGYVKMRRKDIDFTAGGETINLPGGATITSIDGGKRSWLDIVGGFQGTCTIPRVGLFEATGDWFDLGLTNGSSNQEFDYPFLGPCGGIQVETISGSGIYEWYAAAGDRWISGTATLGGSTDPRGKYFGQRAATVTGTTASGTALVTTAATTQLVVGMPIAAAANFVAANLTSYIVSINPGVSFTVSVNANASSSTTFITWRNKLMLAQSSGTVVGYLPPAGCRVRCPNLRLGTSTSPWAGNTLPATYADRYEFVTTAAGKIVIDTVECGWYANFSAAYSIDIRNSTQTNGYIIANTATANILDNCITYYENATLSSGLVMTNCYGGTTISNCRISRYNSLAVGNVASMTDCSDITLSNIIFEVGGQTNILTTRGAADTGAAGHNSLVLFRCFRVTADNITMISGKLNLQGCVDVEINDTVTADTLASTTTATNPLLGIFAFSAGTADVLVDGYSLMPGLTNSHPYQAIILIATGCSDIEFRNFGTAASPINGGTVNPLRRVLDASVCLNVALRRIYFMNLAFGFNMSSVTASTLINTCQGVFLDNCWGDGNDENRTAAVWQMTRGCQWRPAGAGQTSQYGKHIEDAFYSQIAGRVVFSANEPITETEEQIAIISGAPAFTSIGTINMPLVGDVVEWEMPYYAIGHTALMNANPAISGTNAGNFLYAYQIDTGDGWNGTWKSLVGSNLASETIPPYVDFFTMGGFKLKVKATVQGAAAANAISAICVHTLTTPSEYVRQYPLRNPAYSYSVVASTTAFGVFDVASGSLAGSTTVTTSGDITVYPPWDSDYSVSARVRLPGYEPIEETGTVTEFAQSFDAIQTDWATVPDTDPGALGIVVNVSASAMTWNGYPFSITVKTTDDALTAVQVVNYVNFNISKLATWFGYRGLAWGHMVEPDDTDYKTVRGTLFGSPGALLKGVRVVRSDDDTPVPGFTRMMSDNGSYYVLPVLKNATVGNIVPGSRLRVYNTTTANEIANEIVPGSSWSLNYYEGPTTFNPDDLVNIRLTYIPGISGYEGWQTTGVVSTGGLSVLADQSLDAIYNGMAINGSAVTEFSPDYVNDYIEIDDGDGLSSVQRAYAFFCYTEYTEDGIRNWFDAISAPDAVNILIDVSIVDILLNNIDPTPIMIVGGRLYRTDGTTVIAATSESVHLDPDKVYAIATGSGVTAQDKTDIAALTKTRMEEDGSKLTKTETRSRLIPAAL